MENSLIELVARLKIRMRQSRSIQVNTGRFFSDPSYAAQMLDMAEASTDIDLVKNALNIRGQTGWTS